MNTIHILPHSWPFIYSGLPYTVLQAMELLQNSSFCVYLRREDCVWNLPQSTLCRIQFPLSTRSWFWTYLLLLPITPKIQQIHLESCTSLEFFSISEIFSTFKVTNSVRDSRINLLNKLTYKKHLLSPLLGMWILEFKGLSSTFIFTHPPPNSSNNFWKAW